MTIARGQHGAITHPNGNVYVWGGFINGSEFTSLEIYNQATDTWSQGAPIPVATRGMAFALGQDNMIYSFGGYAGGHLNIAHRYDVITNAWTSLASMPVASWECTAATAPNGKIYVFGGENSMNLLQIYDPVLNTWSTGTPLPVMSRMHSAITANNGKIYVIGGWDGSTALPNNQVYDPVLNSWSTGAPLPNPRNQFGSTLAPDGKIYIIGGKFSGGNNTAPFYTNVDVYDPVTDSWTTDFALPVGIGETEAVTINGGINLFGGTSGTYLPSNYRLDLLCGTLGVTTSASSNIICIGQSATLTAAGTGGTPGYTYLWSTGATTSSISVNPVVTTSYTVTVTDLISCTHVSQPILVTVRPPLQLTASGSTTICCNQQTTMSAIASGGDSNYIYTWTPSIGTGPGPFTVSPCVTTTYNIIVTDGCGSPAAFASVTINVNPLPTLTLTAQSDTVCINATVNILFGTPTGGTYFGTGVGGNNFNASLAGTGTHPVNYRYTDTDTITVNVFVDLCTGVEVLNENDLITIFPNPITNELRIQCSTFNIQGVTLYDKVGKRILQTSNLKLQTVILDASDLSRGIYFVSVTDEKNNIVTRKFLKM